MGLIGLGHRDGATLLNSSKITSRRPDEAERGTPRGRDAQYYLHIYISPSRQPAVRLASQGSVS